MALCSVWAESAGFDAFLPPTSIATPTTRSLFGLAEALRKQGRPAASVTASFKKAWKGGPLRVEDF